MAREFKDSGIEWIGQIPKEWDCAALLRSLKGPITDGPHETPVLQENGIPFISVDSLNDTDRVDLSVVKKFISRDLYEEYKKKANIEEGDILFSKAATIGKTAIVRDEVFMVWSPLAIIKPSPRISFGKYMYYVLNCDGLIRHVSFLGTYNTQINVGMRALEKAIIPMPSVVEQQKIADYLDKVCGEVDEMVALQDTMLEELKAYKQSVITEAVTKGLNPNAPMRNSGIDWIGEVPEGWRICRLKFFCKYIKDGTHFSPTTVSEGYPYITATDVRGVGIDYSCAKRITRETFLDLQKAGCQPHKGDVLLVKDGATTGRVGMMVDDEECVLLSSVAMLSPNANILSSFLMYILMSSFMQSQIQLAMAGTALPRITLSKLVNFLGIFPPLSEQQAIASYLDSKCSEIDSLIAIKQQKIEELKDYKKSVIYEYVTGKKEVV